MIDCFGCGVFKVVTAPFHSLETNMFGALKEPSRQIIGTIGGVAFMLFYLKRYFSTEPTYMHLMGGVAYIGRIVLAFILMGTQSIWLKVIKIPMYTIVGLVASGGDIELNVTDADNAAQSIVFAIGKGLGQPLSQLDSIVRHANLDFFSGTFFSAQVGLAFTNILSFLVFAIVFTAAVVFRAIEAFVFGLAPLLMLAWAFHMTQQIFWIAMRLFMGGVVLMLVFATLVGTIRQAAESIISESGISIGAGNNILADRGKITEFLNNGGIANFNWGLAGIFGLLVVVTIVILWATFFQAGPGRGISK